MTISSGDVRDKFGTQTQILSSAAISSGALSLQASAIAWTNSDNAPEADVLVECAFATPPAVGGGFDIISRKLNVRLTNPENEPALGDNENYFHGAAPVSASNPTTQRMTKRIKLRNAQDSQQYEFYFLNRTDQDATGVVAYITPISSGPIP